MRCGPDPAPPSAARTCRGQGLAADQRLHPEKGGEVEQRVVHKLVDGGLDGRSGPVAKLGGDWAAPACGGKHGAAAQAVSRAGSQRPAGQAGGLRMRGHVQGRSSVGPRAAAAGCSREVHQNASPQDPPLRELDVVQIVLESAQVRKSEGGGKDGRGTRQGSHGTGRGQCAAWHAQHGPHAAAPPTPKGEAAALCLLGSSPKGAEHRMPRPVHLLPPLNHLRPWCRRC